MQEYLCNNTRIFLKEYKYVDVIGNWSSALNQTKPYNYVYLYDWMIGTSEDCQMMPWANNRDNRDNRIRLKLKLPVNQLEK